MEDQQRKIPVPVLGVQEGDQHNSLGEMYSILDLLDLRGLKEI